jgi:PIN domain nuclease of toxin-antitoxin system
VSLREIAVLVARGRVRGLGDVGRWWRRTATLGVLWLPLDAEVAIESAHLPGSPPGDPNDQLLLATARVHDLTLATRDGHMLDYARGGYVRALAL